MASGDAPKLALVVMRLAQEMGASVVYSRNGNVLRLTGPTPVMDTSARGLSLAGFGMLYGRAMYTNGGETVPVMTFPEQEDAGQPYIFVSARWFLKNVGDHDMVRVAVGRIDTDADDDMFQTRLNMKSPVLRSELFKQCRVWYCKYSPRDGSPAGSSPTRRSAFELFYRDGRRMDSATAQDAVSEFTDVMRTKPTGPVPKEMRAVIGFAIDNDMGAEGDRLWVAVPRARVWATDFDPDMFDTVLVPPAKKHPVITSIDLLRSADPSIPAGRQRFTVNCDDAGQKPIIYICKKTTTPGGAECSACANAKDCARRTGLMMFARDTGGYPDDVPGRPPTADDVKAHRHRKAYFCANLPGLVKIMQDEVSKGFDVRLPPPWRPRSESAGRWIYEFLKEHDMNFPYGDLDCDLEFNPDMLEEADERTRIAVEFHMHMLGTLFGADVSFQDYLITSADVSRVTTHPDGTRVIKGKVSRHYICKKYVFATMLDQRMFINWCYTVLFAIFRKMETDPALCTEQERLFARLRITDKYNAMRSFPDFGVYKSGCQLFRTYGSTKAPDYPFGPQRRLVLAGVNEYPLPAGATEMDVVELSLVQRVPADFPDNRVLEFQIENNEQIPMMTYELDDDGRVADYHIWNPGDDTSKQSRKRKRKNTAVAKAVVDLSKKYNVGGASGSGKTVGQKGASASSETERAVLAYVAKQPWAAVWEDPGTKNGPRISRGGKVKIRRTDGAIDMICVTPRIGGECPCLMKWYMIQDELEEIIKRKQAELDEAVKEKRAAVGKADKKKQAELDEAIKKKRAELAEAVKKKQVEPGDAEQASQTEVGEADKKTSGRRRKPTTEAACPGHGSCPVSIILHPGRRGAGWVAEQSCSFNCGPKRQADGKREYVYLGEVDLEFVLSLGGQ